MIPSPSGAHHSVLQKSLWRKFLMSKRSRGLKAQFRRTRAAFFGRQAGASSLEGRSTALLQISRSPAAVRVRRLLLPSCGVLRLREGARSSFLLSESSSGGLADCCLKAKVTSACRRQASLRRVVGEGLELRRFRPKALTDQTVRLTPRLGLLGDPERLMTVPFSLKRTLLPWVHNQARQAVVS